MGINSNENRLTPKKAVFIDRDGTLIKHVELMRHVADLKFLPRADKAVKSLNKLGFLVVVITNQPVVARGLITPHGIDKIHAVLIKRLKNKAARVDAVYFCPHHPEATLKKYRLKCQCRKPEPGMILQALRKFKINPKKSFIISDGIIDVVAGKRTGLKTILVKTGPGHSLDKKFKRTKPHFTAENLSEAVEFIKQNS